MCIRDSKSAIFVQHQLRHSAGASAQQPDSANIVGLGHRRCRHFCAHGGAVATRRLHSTKRSHRGDCTLLLQGGVPYRATAQLVGVACLVETWAMSGVSLQITGQSLQAHASRQVLDRVTDVGPVMYLDTSASSVFAQKINVLQTTVKHFNS